MSDTESNCSESVSNRDELTATEQRKNDGATEQQIHNSNEDRNIGKRLFEEVQKPESSFKRQRENSKQYYLSYSTSAATTTATATATTTTATAAAVSTATTTTATTTTTTT